MDAPLNLEKRGEELGGTTRLTLLVLCGYIRDMRVSSCQGAPYRATLFATFVKKSCVRQVALDKWSLLNPTKHQCSIV